MIKDLFDATENQLIVSAELLYLLKWIIDHEPESLRRLISNSLHNGLKKELIKLKEKKEVMDAEDVYSSLIDFMDTMEITLSEIQDEDSTRRIIQKKLMPAIEHIDSSVCDQDTLEYSVEETSSKIQENPSKNPQEILYQEILKNWNPQKKEKV